jgi:Carboxypeptidase regulatory-like domain
MRVLTFGVCLVALLFPAPAIQAQSSATITGHVIDGGTQAPIAGARVILLPAPLARPAGPMGGPPAQAVTGDDGVYTFTGVPEGRYRVQVQKIGFAPPTDTPMFEVTAGQTLAGPDLRLTKGGAMSGRVLDARGEPMAEVMVTALRKPTGGSGRGRGAYGLPVGQPGQTNDIGEFRIAGLPAGDYYVAASPRPMMPLGQSSPSPSPSGGTTLATTYYPGTSTMEGAQVITVAAGQTIGSLEFTMLSAVGYSITGVVVDETNKLVGGAMVILMPTQLVGLGVRGYARTLADGTFRINGVTPGAYRLNASVPVTFSSGGGTVGGSVGGAVTSGSGGIAGSSVSSSSGPSSMLQVTVGDADVTGVTLVVRKPGVQ